MKHNFIIQREVDDNVHKEIKKGLRAFELEKRPDLSDESEDVALAFTSRNANGLLCGGILAHAYWGGVEIDILWVHADFRHQGIGSDLLSRLETDAIDLDAHVMFVKTYDAKHFYAKHGFTTFGILENRPPGTKVYHMQKQIK